MSKTYELVTVDDLLSIPPERQSDFFKEFEAHVKQLSTSREFIIETLIEDEGLTKEEAFIKAKELVFLNSLTWVDDEKNEVETIIRIKRQSTI